MGLAEVLGFARSAPVTPVISTGLSQLNISSALLNGPASRQAAMAIPTATACLNLITGTVTQLPIVRSRGTQELPLGLLLSQPDPDAPISTTLTGTVADLVLYGRAAWIILARDGIATDENPDGLPVRARHVPWELVDVVLDDNIAAYSRVKAYRVGTTELEPRDLIVFDLGRPGVLEAGARTLRSAREVHDTIARHTTFDIPAGILYAEGHELGPDEARELVTAFATSRAHRQVALLQNARYEPVQMSPDDLALSDLTAAIDREVARLFGVPVAMVAASPSGNTGSTMTYANITSNLTQLVQTAVAPILVAIEQTLSGRNVTARGQSVSFAVEAWLRSDPTTSVDYATQLVAAGVITPAEARSFLGIPPAGDAVPSNQPGRIS